MSDNSARISPTAHYTGYVWYRNELSHPALRTSAGALFFGSLWPVSTIYQRLTGGPTLETMLMARHQAIDSQLIAAIEAGHVGQVIEIAAGMSPRGLRFTERYPDLTYIEGDLQAMSTRKRTALESAQLLGPRHHVIHLDALADVGPTSMRTIGQELLDPAVGTAVITEGLVNYFDQATVEGLWARIQDFLGAFPHGLYLSDIHLYDETFRLRMARAFAIALHGFARGAIHMHYPQAHQCVDALEQAGFADVRVDPPAAYGAPPASPDGTVFVRVISATA